MSETKKKQSSGKTASKQPASAAENRKKELLEKNAQRRYLVSVILFAFGILITAFTLFGHTDAENMSAWDAIHTFIYGVFGLSSFLVGPVLIYVAVMLSAERTKSTIAKRMLQFLLIILFLSAAAQVIFVGSVGDPEISGQTFGETVSYVYERGTMLSGGGVAGLVFGTPLLLFGQIGAIVILLLITLVVIMLATNMTVVGFLKGVSKPILKAGSYAKEKHELYKESSAYAEQEREKLEAEEKELRREQKENRAKQKENRLSDEERRARKFDSIANVTTGGQQEVTEEDLKEAVEINSAPKPDPVNIQKQESETYQKNLNEFLSGKIEKRDKQSGISDNEKNAVQPFAGDGPYRPDGPFFVGDEAPEPIKPEIISEQLPSLIGQADAQEVSCEEQSSGGDEGDEIVRAIQDFSREQEEKARAEAEKEEKLLATIIKADESGQQHFEDVVSSAEMYKLPPSELLDDVVHNRSDEDINAEINQNSENLVATLKSFNVETTFLGATRGPSVTQYELRPAPGVKISKITGLSDDIALNLAVANVRIEAPIPGKAAVGIEVPNKTVESVPFRELVESSKFSETTSKLGAVLGKSISGEPVIADIAKMPHILIAGTTGSGKSVCVNSIIMSILFRSSPEEVRFLMIDPKAVEFMVYKDIPHLLIPVVTDSKKAAGALSWAVTEMNNRYRLLSECNVKDLKSYNELAKKDDTIQPLPQIVIFIDELADLMMTAPGEVEDSICQIAQKARAAGMHLVIATQRPSVNVVTGVIKANIPSRIALKVASQVDSRTILDTAGAEKLLGKGDMLYAPVDLPKPLRVQGCWVSDKEIGRVVDFIKKSYTLVYDESVIEEVARQAELAAQKNSKGKDRDDDDESDVSFDDDKLEDAIELVIDTGKASTSFIQTRLKLGYQRATRIMDTMEQLGIVGPYEGSKPRQVIMTKQDWYERKLNKTE